MTLTIKTIESIEKPLRITLAEIERKINANFAWMLNRMPKTNKYITEHLESKEDFKIRRVDYIVKNLIEEQGHISRYLIHKKASVPYTPGKVKDYITEILDKHNQ